MVTRFGLALVAAGTLTCSLDPVHDDAVADLGPETPGVEPGPLHRPGQPCLDCHGSSGVKPAMSVAGTVFAAADGTAPLAGAAVMLSDTFGRTFQTTTNAAGNFYVEPSSWAPIYPMYVTVAFGGVRNAMSTQVGRDGSCAACHVDPASRVSAGHVYLVQTASLLPAIDGGTP
jgi:hypothetical protein